MLRSYWCIGFAALLTASALSAQQSGDASGGDPSAQQGEQIAKKRPTAGATAIDRIADELAKTRKDQSDPYGNERNQRERRDIVAQEESAKWARANFWAIIVQTILAAGALAAILYDISQSRKSAETQTRAFVMVDTTVLKKRTLENGQKRWFIEVDLANKGQTPAALRQFGIKVGWRRKDIAADIIDEIHSIGRDIEVVISPNASFLMSIEIKGNFDPAQWQRGDVLRIWGEFVYFDIFRKRQITKFSLWADLAAWQVGGREINVRTLMHGNNFT